jgi:Fe-Mn family superoxide dismutase
MKRYVIWSSVSVGILLLTHLASVRTETTRAKQEQTTPVSYPHYQAKKFNLEGIPFLSEKQRDQHYKLYEGYVNKLNEIRGKFDNAKRSPGITYSEFRALKIPETFAFNGVLLHEMYFENLIDGVDTEFGELTLDLIEKSFGSAENYLKDLRDCAACSRGWTITGYFAPEDRLYNFVLDAHNETVPVNVDIAVVVDVYEHAYMIDFGIDRAQYLDLLFNALNWQVIEDRISTILKKYE